MPALVFLAIVVALVWFWPLDRDGTLRQCDFEAAKAVAASSETDLNIRLMRKRDVFEACMGARGFRRKDGGTDYSPAYYEAWEKRWPWSAPNAPPKQ